MDTPSTPENKQLALHPVNHLFDWQKWLVTLFILLVAAAGSFYLWLHSVNTKSVYVPGHDLPAYHLIQSTDLISKPLPTADLSSDSLIAEENLIGCYTLVPLGSGEVVTKPQVLSSPLADLVSDTTAVSVPATAATTFNGQLSSGTVVTIWVISADSVSSKTEPLLQRALVLDVQQVHAGTDIASHPYIVTLAVPNNLQAEVLAASVSGSLSFTLVP